MFEEGGVLDRIRSSVGETLGCAAGILVGKNEGDSEPVHVVGLEEGEVVGSTHRSGVCTHGDREGCRDKVGMAAAGGIVPATRLFFSEPLDFLVDFFAFLDFDDAVGKTVGTGRVGATVGWKEGENVGADVGDKVGRPVGCREMVGDAVLLVFPFCLLLEPFFPPPTLVLDLPFPRLPFFLEPAVVGDSVIVGK